MEAIYGIYSIDGSICGSNPCVAAIYVEAIYVDINNLAMTYSIRGSNICVETIYVDNNTFDNDIFDTWSQYMCGSNTRKQYMWITILLAMTYSIYGRQYM